MDDETPQMSPAQALEKLDEPRPVETFLDVIAAAASIEPMFGAVIQTVLYGQAGKRQAARVREVLASLVQALESHSKRLNTEFIKNGDLEDLLFEVVPRVAKERSDEKRGFYRNILLGAVSHEKTDYDLVVRHLQVLEGLQPSHIHLLKAIKHEPSRDEVMGRGGVQSSSPLGTLRSRLYNYSEGEIIDMINDLNSQRVTDFQNPGASKGNLGNTDLRTRLTNYGVNFVSYLAT